MGKTIEIWTDGSCEPNPGIGGWGWHRSDGASSVGGVRNTTNNRMEMTAILDALRKLPDGADATIFSDSQYCINGLTTWRAGWRRRNWMKKGVPLLNRDLWLDLEVQMVRLNVHFEWVRGHSGDLGNERADQLASKGRLMLLAMQ